VIDYNNSRWKPEINVPGCSSMMPTVNAITLQLFSPSIVTQLIQAEHHFRACIHMTSLFFSIIKYLHSATPQPRSIILTLRRSTDSKGRGKWALQNNLNSIFSLKNIQVRTYIYIHTGCNRRNRPDFGRVFLMLNYTQKPQNTYIQSWTVWEIMASEVWNFDSCYTLTDYQTGRNMWFL
jgi:hypothetical protein